ncbi:ABC transporter substrate-binding protein [Wenjunlia vitaminophila]|uniref:ABC transporter substrate-binding protein n=1 Tax=Wenjunlia vitaminophila TaxID=76728 RepID=A0A0T6LT94_WENVI|nr:glutamate ABC transporter substrate-binding protein [Wenjunlia vitaminophila]KRV49071.1 ABC transporter substrate-binding protein [Wenjunlia vitaminophila]
MRPLPTRRAFVLLAAATATVLTGCGSGSSPASPSGPDKKPAAADVKGAPTAAAAAMPDGSTMDRIRERGYLIVGGSSDAPLLSQKNPLTGKYEGFDADMGRLLATYILGEPKVRIVSSATQTREALLKNHTVDVVFQTYSITPERAEQVTFVGPYLSSGFQIATRKDATDISTLADLNGKTVIAGANTPAIPAIKKAAPKAKILTFDSDPACIQALKQGRGKAYVQDNITLAGSIDSAPELKVVGKPFAEGDMGIGVPKDQADMAAFVDTWLKKVIKDGYWTEVWKANFGASLGDHEPPVVGSVPDVYTAKD